MHYIKYLLVSLASALVAAYAALWYAAPAPIEQSHIITVPPLTVQEHQGDLLIWGSWKTVAGYDQPGRNAIEIRCNQAKTVCSEAFANILHHDEGEDIEAQVFNYEVVEWTETLLHAVAKGAMAECIDRNLFVSFDHKTASLEWMPQDGCEGDTGAAVLVGDPL
ncbi:hypothetical protein [Pseudomonas sp. OTU750018]|uniref:hypothetical protein n=1 Tax=Pseudomonas sp. OTU750018 TaxID=2709708 RepID=UPI001F51488C|nr:hypothetical protein [Pseudomonas sp. OTU750018]